MIFGLDFGRESNILYFWLTHISARGASLKTFPPTSSESSEHLIGTDPSHDLRTLYNNLKIYETRLELAVDAAGAGLWSLDLDTYLFWANERTRDMFSFPKAGDISFDDFAVRVHPDDIHLVRDAIQKTLQEGANVDVEYRLFMPERSVRWVHSRGAIYSGAGAKASSIMGVSVDITARKAREKAVDRQLQFESLLVQLSSEFSRPILSAALDGLIEQTLGKILHFVGGDRCAMIMLDLISRKTLITHAYYRDGIKQVSRDVDLASMFPWSVDLMLTGRYHCFSDLDELPPAAAIDRRSYEVMGVKSALRVPLPAKDGSSYVLIIQSLASRLSFPVENLPRLQIFGEVLINAVFRDSAEQALIKSYEEIAALKEKLETEADYLRTEVRAFQSHEKIIGQSEPLNRVLVMVEQVAPTAATVLVSGETGTGKELIAQSIHNNSPRRNKLMVKVNCASLPASLVESELFGRERGAFTGALTRQIGRFELADGSTLFLDEIAEMSLELQAKFLRVLQEGEFERLGSPKTIKVDVRVITATNRDLLEEVRKGTFREDLYYRLSVFPIAVPSLRERVEDIPMLVWEFLREFNEKMGKKIRKVSSNDLASLQAYSWPGNIRELRNVIEHAVIVSSGSELTIRLPENSGNRSSRQLSLEELESRHIEDILRQTGWRIKGDGGAARILGLNPATLYSRMKKLGIVSQRTKDGISTLS